MTDVKRIFFITKDEAKDLQKNLHDPYIYAEVPHYELEDGTILYGKAGGPADVSIWYGEAGETKA